MVGKRNIRGCSVLLFSLFPFVLGLAQSSKITTVNGVDYTLYSDSHYGYSLLVPTTIFIPQGDANTGKTFYSEDNRASLIVYGQPNELAESLEQIYTRERKPEADKSVTYEVLKEGWFVVSGYSGGNVYYQKTFVENEAIKTLRLEYPPSLKPELDPLTSEISWSFSSHGSEATFREAETSTEKPKRAALELIPHTNGEQAEIPPGPTIAKGGTVLWAYIVANTGEVALKNISVGNDLGAQANCSVTYLEPGESTLCVADAVAKEGQHQFTNYAAALAPDGKTVRTEVLGFYAVESSP